MDHLLDRDGVTPIAWRNGLPVWPIMGGSDDDGAGGGDGSGDGSGGDSGGGGEGGGDAGKGGSGDEGGKGGDGDGAADETAGLKSALEKERTGRKAADKQVKDLTARLKKLEDAGKTDDERTTARLAELEGLTTTQAAQLRESKTTLALVSAAIDANAKRPAEAARLVDPAAIEYDDDGNVTNAAEVISAAKARVPELFRGGKPSGDGDGGSRGGNPGGDGSKGPDMDTMLRRAAGH